MGLSCNQLHCLSATVSCIGVRCGLEPLSQGHSLTSPLGDLNIVWYRWRDLNPHASRR